MVAWAATSTVTFETDNLNVQGSMGSITLPATESGCEDALGGLTSALCAGIGGRIAR